MLLNTEEAKAGSVVVDQPEKGSLADDAYVPNTPEEKALIRKIDLWLLPPIWLLYVFSYMDRSNIGNAKTAGMDDALNLSDNDYALALNLFQIGYVLFSVPSNMILSRWKPSLYIPTIMFLWGAVVCCLAAIRTTGQLQALRFLLGVFEAGFSPAIFYIYSSWYTKAEQGKAFIVFWSAGIIAGAFGSTLAGAILSGLEGAHGIEGWRWLFIIEGVLTCGVALVVPFILLDYPADCKKFTVEERALAIKRLEADGFEVQRMGEDGSTGHVGLWKSFVAAFTTPAIWFIYLGFMVVDGSSSISYFYPTLVEGLGYEGPKAQFMTAPLYVCALPSAIITGLIGDKFPRQRPRLLAGTLVCGAIFAAAAVGSDSADYTTRYVLMCFLTMAIFTAIPLALATATATLGPVQYDVRAVALAMMSGLGNLAQIYNSYLWPDSDAPDYLKGFVTYAVLMVFGASLYFSGDLWLRKHPEKLTWRPRLLEKLG